MAATERLKFWSFYESLCLNDVAKHPERLLQLISVLEEERPFKHNQIEKEFAQKLKTWFSSSEDRWIAVCFLLSFLKDCSADSISQDASFWMKSLIQAINSKQNTAIKELALQSISKLLLISTEFQGLSRDFSLNFIHQLLTCLLSQVKTDPECMMSKLAIFRQCIVSYPGPTGRFRSQIENTCLMIFSNSNEALRSYAVSCFAVLPRCGTSGEKGTKYAEFWGKQYMLVMKTVSTLFDDLFRSSGSDDIKGKGDKIATLKLQTISSVEPDHSITIGLLIDSLMLVLEQMLSHKFPNTIRVNIEGLICMCCRMFNIDSSCSKFSIESVCRSSILPQIWRAGLSLLNVGTAQLGSLILPYETRIIQMVYQCLCIAPSGARKSMQKSVRMQAYQLLVTWYSVVGSLQCELLSKVVNCMLQDIVVSCKVKKPASKEPTEKRKKLKHGQKLQQDILQTELAGKNLDPTEDSDLVSAALAALECLVDSSGPLLRVEIATKIQNTVLFTCASATQISDNASALPPPYGNSNCRLLLFKCAFSLLNLYHHKLSTPISKFINIFQHGTTDSSHKVSSYCKHCLSHSDKILRPAVPALREYDNDIIHRNPEAASAESSMSFSMELFNNTNLFKQDHPIEVNKTMVPASGNKTKRNDEIELDEKETTKEMMDIVESMSTKLTAPGQSFAEISSIKPDESTNVGISSKKFVCEGLEPLSVGKLNNDSNNGKIVHEKVEASFEKIDSTIIEDESKSVEHGLQKEELDKSDDEVPPKRQRLGNDENDPLHTEEKCELINKKVEETTSNFGEEVDDILKDFINSYPDSE